jgi:hypothetical protein
MIPHFNRLLEHSPAVTFMLVRSGTSRLVVLDGAQIRAGEQGHEEVLRVMLGSDGNGGLGGPTLQDNKVVLVWPEAEPAHFRFRFLQVMPSSGAVLPMECSNSASASAMLAQFGGHHRGAKSRWRAVNLSTGQKIELRPDRHHEVAKAWTVRFLVSQETRMALRGLAGDQTLAVNGKTVTFRPLLLGNLFLFSKIDPEDVDPEGLDRIERAGMRVAREAGFVAGPGYAPKVIPYRISSLGNEPRVRAASYYNGERHRSFPGSAAMALSAFLADSEVNKAPIPTHWQVEHRSGVIDVDLGFDTSSRVPKLEWTEFVTPVSLLCWGAAAMPWRKAK